MSMLLVVICLLSFVFVCGGGVCFRGQKLVARCIDEFMCDGFSLLHVCCVMFGGDVLSDCWVGSFCFFSFLFSFIFFGVCVCLSAVDFSSILFLVFLCLCLLCLSMGFNCIWNM